MASDLSFNIVALDQASKTLDSVAARLEAVSVQLDRIDGKDATADVNVNTDQASSSIVNLNNRFTLMTAGIVAASPVAGAAILGGIGAGFIGVAGLALKSNADVQASYQSLWTGVVATAKQAAEPLVANFVASADAMSATAQKLGPALQTAFSYAGPDIVALTRGVDAFAQNSMPGVVAAMESSFPVFQGASNAASGLGTAVSAALTSISQHATDYGVVVTSLGQVTESVLGGAVSLVNSMASVWSQNSGAIVTDVRQIITVVSGLASGALPGLSIGLRGVLDVVGGATAVLGPFAQQLGTIGGYALDAVVSFKAFQGVQGLVSGAGDALQGFAEKVGNVSTGAGVAMLNAGKFADTLAGPLGLAMGVVSLGLGILGAKQNEAAQATAQHQRNVDTLSSALEASNGAIDSNVRHQVAASIQSADYYSSLSKLGIPLSDLTDVALGNADAYQRVSTTLSGLITYQTMYDPSTQTTTRNITEQGKSAQQAQKDLDLLKTTFGDSIKKNQDLAAATQGTHQPMTALDKDMAAVRDTTQDAKNRVNSFNDALNILIGDALGAQRAADSFQSSINNLSAQVDHGRVTLTGNSDAAIKNRQSIEQAGEAALQHAEAVFKQTGKLSDAQQALVDDEKALETNATKTYGNRDAVDALLGKLGLMPDQAASALGGMQNFADGTNTALDKLHNKDLTVSAYGKWFFSGSAQVSGMATPRAEGGPIYGPGGPTDDVIPAWLSNGEYVINAKQTAKHFPLLEQINAGKFATGGAVGQFPAFAGGGPVLSATIDPGNLISGMTSWYDQTVTQFGDAMSQQMTNTLTAGGGGAGVAQWAPQILQALSMLGQSAGWLGTVERRMQQESSGDPNIVNTWDINAQQGHPSVGLMQVIASTFRGNAGPFVNTGPFSYGVSVDPLANIYAGLNYAIRTYGSLSALNRPGGYDSGGWLTPGGSGVNALSQPEAVLTPEQSSAFVQLAKSAAGGKGGNTYVLNVYNAANNEIDLRAQFSRMEIAAGIL